MKHGHEEHDVYAPLSEDHETIVACVMFFTIFTVVAVVVRGIIIEVQTSADVAAQRDAKVVREKIRNTNVNIKVGEISTTGGGRHANGHHREG